LKVLRHHAGNCEVLSIKRDASANDASIGIEAALPQTVTENHGSILELPVCSKGSP